MVFVLIQGSHQVLATTAHDFCCLPAFLVGDVVSVPRTTYTRASLQFRAGKPSSVWAFIMILNPRAILRLLLCFGPGDIIPSLRKQLQREFAQSKKREAELLVPHAVTVRQPQDSVRHVQFFALNLQQTITTKLQALCHFLEYQSFP